MTVPLCIRIKEKWWFSQCGRTWLVCRKPSPNPSWTPLVWLLNADLEPKLHHQTPMTCTYGTSGQEGPHYWADCVREEGIKAAHKFKRLNNSDLTAECRDGGWTATIHPVEVGCRGFVGKSAFQLLRAAGTAGISLRRATKELVKEAEKASYWLWLRRRDRNWGSVPPVRAAAGGGLSKLLPIQSEHTIP